MSKKSTPEKRGRGRPPMGDDAKGYVFGVRLDGATSRGVKTYGERGGDLVAEVRAYIVRRLKAAGLLK